MKNSLLLVCVIAVGCIVMEWGLRIIGFAPRVPQINAYFIPDVDTTWSVPDSDLGWINRPGVALAIGADPAPMTFWDFSRRASRPTSDIPQGNQMPVMIVGGSVAQSYGVRDRESFPYLLAERYPELWIENFGTGGYGTVQSTMLAREAYDGFYPPGRKPKLVVLTFAGSHIIRNVSHQSWVFNITDTQGRRISPPHYRLNNTDMAFYPFRIIDFWPLELRSAAFTVAHDVWLRHFEYDTASQGVAVSQQVIRSFWEFASQRDMALAIVVVADDSQTTGMVLKDSMIPHKDCSGPDRLDPRAYLLAGNGHPNQKLHMHYLDCISEWLDTDILPSIPAYNVPFTSTAR